MKKYMDTIIDIFSVSTYFPFIAVALLGLTMASCSHSIDTGSNDILERSDFEAIKSAHIPNDSTLFNSIKGSLDIQYAYDVGSFIKFSLYGKPRCEITEDSIKVVSMEYKASSFDEQPKFVSCLKASYEYSFVLPNLLVVNNDSVRIFPCFDNTFVLEGKYSGIVVIKK